MNFNWKKNLICIFIFSVALPTIAQDSTKVRPFNRRGHGELRPVLPRAEADTRDCVVPTKPIKLNIGNGYARSGDWYLGKAEWVQNVCPAGYMPYGFRSYAHLNAALKSSSGTIQWNYFCCRTKLQYPKLGS